VAFSGSRVEANFGDSGTARFAGPTTEPFFNLSLEKGKGEMARGDVDGTAIIVVFAWFNRRKAAANVLNSRD